ncbi:alpha/beta fold hydrolase [Streptomyces mirabilis]|uniref:alpha/beta fold hydrolase n=1 Tax=Streptomyces mirabilis TaxID=68239 RepID=UPI003323BE55
MEEVIMTHRINELQLENGKALRDVEIRYRTYGRLDAEGSNAVLYPTWFLGRDTDNCWAIGPGKALDPDRYFVVVPNLIGNGLSTSPSCATSEHKGSAFPVVTYRDQVHAQHDLLVRALGIQRLHAVVGWSMGASQALHWGVEYPASVGRIMASCGTARTTEHNRVFLDGVTAAITADSAFADGDYREQPVRGLRAAGRVYAGWAFSQAFYREQAYRTLGFRSCEDFVSVFWEEEMFVRDRDANDVLSMIETWKQGDVASGPRFNGNLAAALGSIRASTLILAAEQDLYFCAEDLEYEASCIPGARFEVLSSVWGHAAGAGVNPVDSAVVDQLTRELLEQ